MDKTETHTVSLIIDYSEYKGAKIEIFTSIKIPKFYTLTFYTYGKPPKQSLGQYWDFTFFPYYSPYKTSIKM